jgi:hypothetical protein
VWTLIVAFTAPLGAVALIVVSDTTTKGADTTPKSTAVAPVKPLPLMLIGVPTGPPVGVNAETVGAAAAAGMADPTSEPPAIATTAHAVAIHRQ